MATRTTITFSDEASALSLPAPDNSPAKTYPHDSIPNFCVTVLKPRKDGKTTRQYIARWSETVDGKKTDKRVPLGIVGDMRFTAAVAALDTLMKEVREARTEGRSVIPTLADAFRGYMQHKTKGVAEDKRLRARTVEDYTDRYNQLVPDWLAKQRLDALTWDRWQQFRSWVTSEQRTEQTGRAPLGEARIDGFLRGAISGMYNHWGALLPGKFDNPIRHLRERGVLSTTRKKQDHIKPSDLAKAARVIMTQMTPAARDITLIALCSSWRNALVLAIPLDRIDEQRRTVAWSSKDPGGPYDEDPEVDGQRVPFPYPVPDWLWDTVFAPRLLMKRPGQRYLIESNRSRGKPFADIREQLQKLDKALGYHVTGHSLRRTFATVAAGTEAAPAAVTHLMMHKTARTGLGVASNMTMQYTQRDTEAMRKAANVVVARMVEAMQLGSAVPAPAPAPAPAKAEAASEGATADLAKLLAGLSPEQLQSAAQLLALLKGKA